MVSSKVVSWLSFFFNLFLTLVIEKWRVEMDRLYPNHGMSFCLNSNGNLFNCLRTLCETSFAPDLEFANDAVLFTPSHEAAPIALAMFTDVAT